MEERTPTGGPPPNNTLGVVALVLGIVSIPLVLCFGIGLAIGAAAVVLGALGIYRVNQGRATNRGQALAGLVCGAIAVVAAIILFAIW